MEKEQQQPFRNLSRKLENFEGAVEEIFIPDLLAEAKSNVIVVDGSNFYGVYVYPKFDWICGDLAELVNVISRFVLAFENFGIKLAFFFVDGHIDEGKRALGSEEWSYAHSEYAKYGVHFYNSLKKTRHDDNRIKKEREYYHCPFHAQSVVLYVLKYILKCEINFVDPGFRNDSLAYYARNHNCLGILVEDKNYFFYKDLPSYLSLKSLDVQIMKTKLYHTQFLPRYFGISEKHLYPYVIQNFGEENSDDIIDELNRIIEENKDEEFVFYNGGYHSRNEIYSDGNVKTRDDYDEKEEEQSKKEGEEDKLEELANQQIGKADTHKGKEEQEMKKEDSQQNKDEHEEDETDSETDSESSSVSLASILRIEYIVRCKGYTIYTKPGPFGEQYTIYLRAKELCMEGLMSSRVKILLETKSFFNDCILEDFNELPPSSLIYQPLRKKMYSILFCEFFPKYFNGNVLEWCMSERGCRKILVKVDPLEAKTKNMHLGLLKLWNLNDVSKEVMTAKWHLFSSCISFRLRDKFQNLPPTLVVPTAVLFYLHQIVPRVFKNKFKIMESWEIDLFIVHFLMISKIPSDDLSKIIITKYNSRAVKLIAMFVYGCLNMHLLVEVCGCFINKNDTCLLHYFNGKLFHNLYEKAEWKRKGLELQLTDEESLNMFHEIKEIVFAF